MPLIEYVEPVSIGSLFIGIGTMTVSLVMAYIFYRFYLKLCQFFDLMIHRLSKEIIFQEAFLDRIALKKGIDLNKELIKKGLITEKAETFREKLLEEMWKEMFGKETKKKA